MFTPMKETLTTIKVTESAKKNFNLAAATSGKKQWEVSEEASKDVLKKLSSKVKSSNGKK